MQLQAVAQSRSEDEMVLGLMGTVDARWNKATKLDVVGVDAKDVEEQEIMRRLLGPNVTVG